MKLIAFSLVLLCWSTAAVVHGQSNAAFSPNEAVCGFLGNFQYIRPDQMKHGLAVDLVVGDTTTNQPVTLRFFVHERPRNFPVDDLQVEHEKLMHVIGVRDDLGDFFHVHPARVSPGLWAVSHLFTKGGNYKIWSDVKYHGTSYAFEHPILTVAGGRNDHEEACSERNRVEVSGCQVELNHFGPLLVGQINRLQFVVRNSIGSRIRTENFLGTPMHLIIIKDNLSVFLHAHPDSHGTPDQIIYFSQRFPQAGRYKCFAQFRPMKSKLPRDEALLAEFYVNVSRGNVTKPELP